MVTQISRRDALAGASAALLAGCASMKRPGVSKAFADLEARAGGRLGVCALDTATGAAIGHRTDQRFGMCSTFKLALAAAVLRESDQGRLALDQMVAFSEADMVMHAPSTKPFLEQGAMTVLALAEAVQTTSDNVAANLLLKLLGGPEGFTRILRDWGDPVTRLDRLEPEMNIVRAGDMRDTTTPAAHAALVAKILTTEDCLAPESRERLIRWMVATQTGLKRLRAGFPQGWRAGDKTGTFLHDAIPNKTNDVAIVWPPGRAPVIVAAYYESPAAFDDIRDEDQAVLAEVGRLVGAWAV